MTDATKDGHRKTEPGRPNPVEAEALAILFEATHGPAMKMAGVKREEITQLVLDSPGPDAFLESAHQLLKERLALNGAGGELHHA